MCLCGDYYSCVFLLSFVGSTHRRFLLSWPQIMHNGIKPVVEAGLSITSAVYVNTKVVSLMDA